MVETLLEIDGIETCYGLSQVLFGLSLKVLSLIHISEPTRPY